MVGWIYGALFFPLAVKGGGMTCLDSSALSFPSTDDDHLRKLLDVRVLFFSNLESQALALMNRGRFFFFSKFLFYLLPYEAIFYLYVVKWSFRSIRSKANLVMTASSSCV